MLLFKCYCLIITMFAIVLYALVIGGAAVEEDAD